MAKCIYKNLPNLSEARKVASSLETIYDSVVIPESVKNFALEIGRASCRERV